MKISILTLFSVFSLCGFPRIESAKEPECGWYVGGALCPDNLCCSYYGFCGNTSLYCNFGCQSQCLLPSPSPPPPPPSPSPPPPADEERPDHRCGKNVGNSPCSIGKCCSSHGWCGSTFKYCLRPFCDYQCWKLARWVDLPPALLQHDITTTNAISNIITEPLFDEMLTHRKDCPSQEFYNYESFIIAAESFPEFCTTGDVATRTRELSAFFALTSQATEGEWSDSSDRHSWGYCFINRTTSEDDYCTSSQWSCALGKKYNSRGPFQLTHNYNYGLASGALGVDLINNPDLVATDSVVSFQTAIWYWMTQHHDKPSFHNILVNANSGLTQLPTYGKSNDGLLGTPTNVVGYYKRYCDILEVTYGDILEYMSHHATFFPKISHLNVHVV